MAVPFIMPEIGSFVINKNLNKERNLYGTVQAGIY